MVVKLILLIGSLIGLAFSLLAEGQSDFVLLAGPMAVASLLLLLRSRTSGPRRKRFGGGLFAIFRRKPRWIVVDGSNVMHWRENTPHMDTLLAVIGLLQSKGHHPAVVFDANAGYKLFGRYVHDAAFAKHLGLSENQVFVVNKGTIADQAILAVARDLGACIVTNDHYKDWSETYPEVFTEGHLVHGGYRQGQPWLGLAAAKAN